MIKECRVCHISQRLLSASQFLMLWFTQCSGTYIRTRNCAVGI